MFKIVVGFWFGCITVAGMLMPFEYQPGAIFDGRSVILSLSALFGGAVSAGVSVLIAGTYRIYLGGPGIWAGLGTIIFCSLAGLLFRRLYKGRPESIGLLQLLEIGVDNSY
ncbi:MAG: hypothetical protein HC830_08615 [Bacteroidetes bacterium]|nr:hypothetical protein [Bacteroidota bacterium]